MGEKRLTPSVLVVVEMRLPRPELDGISLAEALDDPTRRDLAWALVGRLGEP